MKVVLNPKYENLRPWIEQLPEHFEKEGRIIYNARNQIRIMRASDGSEVCVKRFHAPRFLNRLIYSYWRAPKAMRAYENALRLKSAGIGTPEPIAYILNIKNGLLEGSYLICQKSVLTRNFYEFRHHSLNGYEYIVSAFARFTAFMHEQGILHKDYSPGNILFDLDEKGQPMFELVDINRMVFGHPVNMATACHNFCRLWGREDFFILLAQEYAKSRGFDEGRCIQLTIRYWKRFWRFRR